MNKAKNKPALNRLILAGGALTAASVFLVFSAGLYRTGFPLDDAWIHQTYARNLAVLGQWAFIPGEPSAGSTAPLWSVLLALGYWLNAPPLVWAYFLGACCLASLGIVGEKFFLTQTDLVEKQRPVPWFGLFLVFEWHVVWAAVSGMETILHAFGVVLILYLISSARKNWLWIGLMIGVIVWVRPDGLTLLGPAGFVIVLEAKNWRERLQKIGHLVCGFLIAFIPYLLFNFMLSGSLWPNTFYAKQAEYAILYQFPLFKRLIDLYSLPVVGAGAMLLPGVLYGLWWAGRQQRWSYFGAFLWWAGYTGLYALRLPVTYHHGRYLIPAMPVYFLLGAIGMKQLFCQIKQEKGAGFIFRRAWWVATVIVWAAFFVLGARAYAEDVAIIETEMVESAKWIAENTPPDALIAAHDIGAMGYYGNRDLVDLAGLISPEVIPFIRDEARLADYIDEQGVDYLIVFPGWYDDLHERSEVIYRTKGTFSPAAGGENMTVYRWGKQ